MGKWRRERAGPEGMKPGHVVKKELDKLDQMGWVLSWTRGNQKGLKANPNLRLGPGLKSFLDKTQTLTSFHKISTAYFFKEILPRMKSRANRSEGIIASSGGI
jgi:hypothetical protein